MNERRAELLVGIVIIVGVIIFVLGIVWGKGEEVLAVKTYYRVQFENIAGLKRGDPVYVRGVEHGRVESVDLEPGRALVRFWITGDAGLNSDMRIGVGVMELMGGKHLGIDPGQSGRPADPDSLYCGESMADMWEILARAQGTLSRADTLFRSIQRWADSRQVGNIIKNVEEATYEAKRLLAENRKDLHLAVQHLEEFSSRLASDSMLTHMDRLILELDTTITAVKKTALKLDQGTLGRMLEDRWLYDQLMQTTFELDSLIRDIRQNPKKYVKFSLF